MGKSHISLIFLFTLAVLGTSSPTKDNKGNVDLEDYIDKGKTEELEASETGYYGHGHGYPYHGGHSIGYHHQAVYPQYHGHHGYGGHGHHGYGGYGHHVGSAHVSFGTHIQHGHHHHHGHGYYG